MGFGGNCERIHWPESSAKAVIYLQNADYHGAVDEWLKKHADIIFCFVQFMDKKVEDMPDVYLATSGEVATNLKKSGGGLSDTILHVEKTWKKGKRAGYQSPVQYAASLTPSLAPGRPAKPGLPSARDGQTASAVSTSTN